MEICCRYCSHIVSLTLISNRPGKCHCLGVVNRTDSEHKMLPLREPPVNTSGKRGIVTIAEIFLEIEPATLARTAIEIASRLREPPEGFRSQLGIKVVLRSSH